MSAFERKADIGDAILAVCHLLRISLENRAAVLIAPIVDDEAL
jgi:hypothetical protein